MNGGGMGRGSILTFLAGGDVALRRKSPRGAFGRLSPLLQKTDLAFANLEHAHSERGEPVKGKYVLRGAPELAHAFKDANFAVLSFANNHALDYGEEAFSDTLELMRDHSIPIVGAGGNLEAARKPVVLERNGLRMGVLAFCSVLPREYAARPKIRPKDADPLKIYFPTGVNPLRASTAYLPAEGSEEYPGRIPKIVTWAFPEDLRRMKADIKKLRKRVDVLLVNHHWGTSMVHEVREFQREIAHAAIDAGADVVLGGHPHVLQGIEFHRGKPIVYSMGNLIFDYDPSFFTDATRQTFLFGCKMNKTGASNFYALPCRGGKFNAPVPLSPLRGAGRRIFDLLSCLSEPWGTQIRAEKDRIAIIPPNGEQTER
jgi:poly-gamma-glutamate synthesis protein (capsule biosynthesis protein)